MEPAADPLVVHLDALVDNLRELIPAALKEHDEKSVHHARVSTRRLKAAIDVLERVVSPDHRKPLARALSKLRKQLGPMRDADVMLGHLTELPAQRFDDASEWLRLRLTKDRAKAAEHASVKHGPAKMLARLGAWWGVREELVEKSHAVDTLLIESLHLQLDAFAELANAAGDANVAGVDPHQLRIAGKALRYTLELAEARGHKLPARVARTFKRLQDALGLWHDFVVLAEQILRYSLDELVAHHDPKLQGQLLDLSRHMVRRSAQKLEGFSRLWERDGDALAATVRTALPLALPVEPGETKVDHKPAGSF